MKLNHPRLGHISNGRLYLANKGEDIASYVQRVRIAYGSLHGVQIVRVAQGAHLQSFSMDGYSLPSEHEYELVHPNGKIRPKTASVLVVDRTSIGVDHFYAREGDAETVRLAVSSFDYLLRYGHGVTYPYRISLDALADRIEHHCSRDNAQVAESVAALRRSHEATASMM